MPINRSNFAQMYVNDSQCKWTVVAASKAIYCRVNGRLFRREPRPDWRLDLSRVGAIDETKGDFIGRYARRDATSAVAEIA
ncbi:hypothetical protein [Novosphingobium sp. PhB165]|uniref:hypothetical protein n=1 Tax=Novosphingobium sp. PhB165 TaxID=2485105 RepID=UPI0014050BC9|nr:hypothetical protein [Novosphingobium sp. PhB165]